MLTPLNVTPLHKGSLVDGAGSNVFVSGNYAYVADRRDALEIIDVSDPAYPVHKSTIKNGTGGAILVSPNSVYVSGNYAYVTGSNALEIIDIGTVTSTEVNVVSPTQITGTFDLIGKTAGDYNVVVTNPDGQFGTRPGGFAITADIVDPVAAFTSNLTSGNAPLSVQFNDTSTGNPTMWSWSFGDEQWFNTTDIALQNATHVYHSTGTFTVNLTVTNASVPNTASKTGYINVTSGVLPLPGFTNS
jgi:PKD repeat protein